MATRFQVTCINKSDRLNLHERILSIGGTKADGSRWKLSQRDAIAGLVKGALQFYVNVGGYPIGVIVAKSAQGHKYLKTQSDGIQPDNLLSLPECP